MKKVITGLVGCFALLLGSLVHANGLGEGDDTYIGFQIRVPFAAKRKNLFSGHAEYSVTLVKQTNGVKNGLLFTQDTSGNQAMSYVLSDFTLALVTRNEHGVSYIGSHSSNGADVFLGVVGVVAFVKLVDRVSDEIVDDIFEDIAE